MSAGKHLQLVAGVEGWKPGLGITPAIEKQLALAARSIRRAIYRLDRALQMGAPGSDTDQRCSEVIEELRGVLEAVEWQPPDTGARS